MKNLKFYVGILSACILASCGGVQPDFTVNGEDARSVFFEDVAVVDSVMPLHFTEPVSVGNAFTVGDEMLIIDSDYRKMWILKDHRQIAVLDAHGRGHGEYRRLYESSYSPEGRELLVWSEDERSFLKYEVPSMRFAGKIQLDIDWISNFTFVSDKLIFGFGADEDSNPMLFSMNVQSGEVRKITDISNFQDSYCSIPSECYNSSDIVIGMPGYVNSIAVLGKDGSCTQRYRFCFADGMPEEMYDNANDISNYDNQREFVSFRAEEHYFFNVVMPEITDSGCSFWYCNNNGPEGDDTWLRYYGRDSASVVQYKDFTVPGLNLNIQPDGLIGNGSYYSLISGPADMIEDSTIEPSSLAKQILDAVNNQNDDNPVIMYWHFK